MVAGFNIAEKLLSWY